MKTIYWVKGDRGVRCLRRVLQAGFPVDLLVLQAQPGAQWYREADALAGEYGITKIAPEDPNAPETAQQLRRQEPDLMVLAGYGKILRRNILAIPRLMCLNLHGGKLPENRGSSPMNWALIKGQREFGISIIKLDVGVDTGDVLLDRTFPITEHDTIRDLHAKANEHFPEMLVEVLGQLEAGTCDLRKQDPARAAYYPLRFPEDGLILWDMLTAEQIHNRIRALTEPYPCAYTYRRGRKVKLISSTLRKDDFHGEPGRVYLKRKGRLLVCALDKCLWIDEAIFADSGQPLFPDVARYECLATVRAMVERFHEQMGEG